MKVDRMLTIRENRHATFTVSVPPEQIQEASEAIAILALNEGNLRGKSQGALKAILREARRVAKKRPDIIEFLRPQLEVFSESEKENSEISLDDDGN